jgi:hypothetical protein
MFGRKKVVRGELKQLAPLADRLARFAGNEGEEAEVRKDTHLVAAALEGRLPVISLDDRMRRFLVRCLRDVPHLGVITWVNPLHPEEDILAWLERGALDEVERQLQGATQGD